MRQTQVLGRAARAVMAGKYAQAVGLHRQLETMRPGVAHQFGAAGLAARGLLAARAGDWAASAEWYRLAVGMLYRGPLDSPATWRCRIRGCTRELEQDQALRCG
jgi:hypothetical protein